MNEVYKKLGDTQNKAIFSPSMYSSNEDFYTDLELLEDANINDGILPIEYNDDYNELQELKNKNIFINVPSSSESTLFDEIPELDEGIEDINSL
jgi:hypothetical protein